ncbi:glycerophosphodiester phosphodiesterase [Sphingomonas rosea]|uniref:glycerophosphodiester phosphodiesterase n=1 Tax=Sphingomonas rosea TaxID=335605 RepID=A0ABP7U6R1_9SPHN
MAPPPISIFGHRGACAFFPEHSLPSYARAAADGADYLEPDLVISRDGVLIARHEPNLAATTDVARFPDFADRFTTKVIDGHKQRGWFAEDFTLAELKRLRTVERRPATRPLSAAHDGEAPLVTWDELLDFTAAESARQGRPIGLVPELKHSSYFRSIGLPLEEPFLASLDHRALAGAPLIVQSFEIANLKAIRAAIGRPSTIRLMQLVDPARPPQDRAHLTAGAMLSPAGLAAIAGYADILGPDKASVIPCDLDGRLGHPTALVADAAATGLPVMPYTFRPENRFLPADLRSDAGPDARHEAGSIAEIRAYVMAGIAGLFADDPALARRAIGS